MKSVLGIWTDQRNHVSLSLAEKETVKVDKETEKEKSLKGKLEKMRKNVYTFNEWIYEIIAYLAFIKERERKKEINKEKKESKKERKKEREREKEKVSGKYFCFISWTCCSIHLKEFQKKFFDKKREKNFDPLWQR